MIDIVHDIPSTINGNRIIAVEEDENFHSFFCLCFCLEKQLYICYWVNSSGDFPVAVPLIWAQSAFPEWDLDESNYQNLVQFN